MTIDHFVYIPFVVMLGFLVGWKIGASNVRGEWDRAEKRRLEREE